MAVVVDAPAYTASQTYGVEAVPTIVFVDRGGTVLFFAPTEPEAKIEIPFNALWREEITIISSYGGSPRDIRDAIQFLAERRVAVADLVTHVLPLAEAPKAFRLVASAQDSLKVVLRP